MLQGGLGLSFPKFCHPVLDAVEVGFGSGKLETVEQRNAAFLRHDISGIGKIRPEIAIAGGNDAFQEGSVGGIVQEPDHLTGHSAPPLSIRKGRQDQEKGGMDNRKRFRPVPRDAECRVSKFSMNRCVFPEALEK